MALGWTASTSAFGLQVRKANVSIVSTPVLIFRTPVQSRRHIPAKKDKGRSSPRATCARARDLVLKLANRRLYLIAAAIAELAQEKLAALGTPAVNPAVLEILPIAVRRGWNTPEKAAFAHRHPAIRGRVAAHRAFEVRLGAMAPTMGRSFSEVLNHVDAHLAFGVLKP